MTAPWPKSIHPADREPAVWHPMLDGIAKLYRHRKSGERFAGMTVSLIGEDETSVLLLLGVDGSVRRLVDTKEPGAA